MLKNQDILDGLNWRYATKKFDSTKKISDNNFETLLKSLQLSASSYGLQPWKFIVVKNRDILEKLVPISWNQKQITDCSHFIVFAGLKSITPEYIDKHIENTAKVRNIDLSGLEDYKSLMNNNLVNIKDVEWSARQAYIALGTLMLSASLLNIDSCPMEGLDPEKYDEILDMKSSDYSSLCACALGYRSDEDDYAKNKKVRFDMDDIISYL
jgi:nitroreductase